MWKKDLSKAAELVLLSFLLFSLFIMKAQKQAILLIVIVTGDYEYTQQGGRGGGGEGVEGKHRPPGATQ